MVRISFKEVSTTIISCTRHPASPEQIAQGVVDISENRLPLLRDLLTLNDFPSENEIYERFVQLVDLVSEELTSRGESLLGAMVMTGRMPYLTLALVKELIFRVFTVLYSISRG